MASSADPGLHRQLGLTDDEAVRIEAILGRGPNPLELAMYSVMWSEHCSYKSSIAHLGRLPTQAPYVLVGPGENAGVIDVGEGLAVALRIESHNHPSAIEPFQGAATGVGGIIRDIFTMGARPIALLDSLRFGLLDSPAGRWLLEGVVSGISGYGNSVGVPTVGGEIAFDPCYAGNPLVNVMCVGLMKKEALLLARASGEGNLAVLLGSPTGRDGIGGVSVLASAVFDDGAEAESRRPSVQVGDPFEEKRLIEACLDLYAAGLVIGIQDLGGAGLTCATSETASRGGVGLDVDLSAVPLREQGMMPPEIMISESQERMLAIVAPPDLPAVLETCGRWEVRASVIGRVTAGGRLRILSGPGDAEVLADVPAASLHEDAPRYQRPMAPPPDLDARRGDDPARLAPPDDCAANLLAMLADSSWVWSQYDHQLFLNTVAGPGGDATVLLLKAPGLAEGSAKALALTVDGNGRWCAVDPRRGSALVVAEAALNIACAGASALAVVDCLNLGDPENPVVMWQLSEVVDGLAEACLGLHLPVVGGNVSLYNTSAGRDIDPTPVVGMVGLIDHLDRRPPGVGAVDGGTIVLLGNGASSLAGSRWADVGHHHRGGELAPVDFEAHGRLCQLVRSLVADGWLDGVHDVSDGGLGVALAEMALAGNVGMVVGGVAGHTGLFAEGPSRVVACVRPERLEEIAVRSSDAGMSMVELGRAGGDRLVVEGLVDLAMAEVADAWRDAIPKALTAASGG